jgi:hypothetical protein
MPALVALKHNPVIKTFGARLTARTWITLG